MADVFPGLHGKCTNINCIAAACGDADACVGTEVCTTATFSTPSATTITTCVPTPTCLGVYGKLMFFWVMGNVPLMQAANCESGGGNLGICCSGYCAATKCRPTDEKWPRCNEDNGPCLADENCCYKHQCVKGICTKQ